MKNILQKVLMLIVLTFITNSTLKSQTDWTKKQWQTINEGLWNVKYADQVGNYIITSMTMNDGKTPTTVDGKSKYSPLLIWDMEKDSFLTMTDNWIGDPMDPVQTFKCDSVTYYVTDRVKMYKVEIDFKSKHLTYTKVFQGFENTSSLSKIITGFQKGNNYLYFYGHHFIHLFELNGNFIKSYRNYEDGESTISSTTSVVEYNDTVYFGYTFIGGLSDGSGMATIDLTTGKITKQYGFDWNGSFHYEPILKLLKGHFYLYCDAAKYGLNRVLFEYTNNIWKAVIFDCGFPELVNNKIKIPVAPNGRYIDGDTINRSNVGKYYLLENNIATEEWPDDPRLSIQFDEDYKYTFNQIHGNMPYVDFIYEFKGKVYGFGPHVVAELVDKPTSISKVSLPEINVYPNPAHDYITVNAKDMDVEFSIIDITGKTVLKSRTGSGIDITSLQKGFYIIIIPGFNPRRLEVE